MDVGATTASLYPDVADALETKPSTSSDTVCVRSMIKDGTPDLRSAVHPGAEAQVRKTCEQWNYSQQIQMGWLDEIHSR